MRFPLRSSARSPGVVTSVSRARETEAAMTMTQHLEPPERVDLLRDRVAMVTGGTRGIGAAICKELAAAGASIAAGDHRHDERSRQFLAGMAADHPGRRGHPPEGNLRAHHHR